MRATFPLSWNCARAGRGTVRVAAPARRESCGRCWLPESKFLSIRRDPRGSVTAVVLEENARGHSGLRGPGGGVSVGGVSFPRPVNVSDHSSFPESCLSS